MSWYLPDGHLRQLVSPSHALYWPCTHEWHVPPVDGWYLPMEQSLHAADPTTACCPSVHASQTSAL